MIDYIGLDSFLLSALKEDIGTGDVTTLCCVPENRRSKAVFRAKQDGIICGLSVGARVFALLDDSVVFKSALNDGDKAEKGKVIASVSGPSASILTGERVALNLLQHLSGIATKTAAAVEAVASTRARVCDTRKTTPGMRILEKYAVRCGGGSNHRFNLSDGVLIKDNHIVAAGGIKNAVEAVRKSVPHTLKIEVEASTPEQVDEALAAGADIIMLDNMSLDEMRQAVLKIGGRAIVEASGNMGERDLRQVAQAGVDLISIGALTHSFKAMDISLQFEK